MVTVRLRWRRLVPDEAREIRGVANAVLHPTFYEQEVRLIGNRWSPRVHELKRFLARSAIRFLWFDVDSRDDPELRQVLGQMPEPSVLPIVLLPDGSVLLDPDVGTLAERLGLPTEPGAPLYDLAVIGGGPAGVSAAIYAASEGLHTVVVEQEVPGGQISYSAMVENYPGFPHSMDGRELAQRAVAQAERFGVEFIVTRRATGLRADDRARWVTLDDGAEVVARTVLLTIGVSFRWLDAPGCAQLVGAGVYYGAVTAEAAACSGQEVYVLGGGNSAGQAALFLARYARRVHVLTHGDSLDESMSRYLIDRIERTPNITAHLRTTVEDAGGPGHLTWLRIRDVASGATRQVDADALFVFIGAAPRSDWLAGTVDLDDEGFVLTGLDYLPGKPEGWPLERRPELLETRIPGVFVAGDVRKGSVKRLTVAAGEGAMSIAEVHRYLRESAQRDGAPDAGGLSAPAPTPAPAPATAAASVARRM
jgi:thioredoxin reductase (NADPH)